MPSAEGDERGGAASRREPFTDPSDEKSRQQKGEAARQQPHAPEPQVGPLDLVERLEPQRFDGRDRGHRQPRRLVGIQMPAEERLVERRRQACVVREMPVHERLRQAKAGEILIADAIHRDERDAGDQHEQEQLVPRPAPRKRRRHPGAHRVSLGRTRYALGSARGRDRAPHARAGRARRQRDLRARACCKRSAQVGELDYRVAAAAGRAGRGGGLPTEVVTEYRRAQTMPQRLAAMALATRGRARSARASPAPRSSTTR